MVEKAGSICANKQVNTMALMISYFILSMITCLMIRPTSLNIQDTGTAIRLGLIDTESKVRVLITQFSSVQFSRLVP